MRQSRRGAVAFRAAGSPAWDIQYSGNYDVRDIVAGGRRYRLYTLTSSGELTIMGNATGDIWLCGGGAGGCIGSSAGDTYRAGVGGGGAYARDRYGQLLQSGAVTIGRGGLESGNGSATTYLDISAAGGIAGTVGVISAPSSGTGAGGAGGGTLIGSALAGQPGTGDGISKVPFGDAGNFVAHCAGGGSGGGGIYGYAMRRNGGDGGTDGGNGVAPATTANTGGAGGVHGGGQGGGYNAAGQAATYYGGGGGGGSSYRNGGTTYIRAGAAGFQGVCYIRVSIAA